MKEACRYPRAEFGIQVEGAGDDSYHKHCSSDLGGTLEWGSSIRKKGDFIPPILRHMAVNQHNLLLHYQQDWDATAQPNVRSARYMYKKNIQV